MTRRATLHCLPTSLAGPLAAAAFIVLLGACKPVSPPAPAPANGALPVVLVITGTDAAGSPARLELPAATGLVYLRPTEEIKQALVMSTTSTPYVELALVKAGSGNNWRLFYAEPPAGLATPTAAQMYINPAVATTAITGRASSVFTIMATQPLSATAVPGTLIPLEDAIFAIKRFDNELDLPNNQLVGRLTPFVVLTDGAAQNPRRTLVIFGAIQGDGTQDPPETGICDDVRVTCQQTDNGHWYCSEVIVQFVCS